MFKTHRNNLVVGLGVTGLSCIGYLRKRNEPVLVIDNRKTPPGLDLLQKQFPDVPVKLDKFQALEADFHHAKQIVLSPGLSLSEPIIQSALSHGVPVVGDIELFTQAAKAPVVGITGTNGKSTVTTLVGEMVKAADLTALIGGNLGTPALDLLEAPTPDFYILELSSFQLETTRSLKTEAAVILNIAPDHLDRYAVLQDYLAAKQRIYAHCHVPVVNLDDKATIKNLSLPNHRIGFHLNKPRKNEFGLNHINGINYLAHGDKNLLSVDQLKIRGRHQWANALASLALGQAIGLPMTAMIKALQTFEGLTHRCQWVREINGVNWYNDSKATNVAASVATIQSLSDLVNNQLLLIMGGQGKNEDFAPLKTVMNEKVRRVILIGRDAALIGDVIKDSVAHAYVQTMDDAVKQASEIAKTGDAVALVPACASFDMFKDFNQRGEVFMKAVKRLV